MATISEALAVAIQNHQAGRLEPAAETYRRILAAEPDHPHALHLLGIIAGQTGRYADAIELIGRAVRRWPSFAAFHNSLGDAYRGARRSAEAVDCYRRALNHDPDLIVAYNNLALTLRGMGDPRAAVARYREAIQRQPESPEVYTNLGSVLKDLGELDESIACHRRAIELAPDFAEAHNNLGNALKERGDVGEAVDCFRRALEFKPRFPWAHANLIYTLHFSPEPDAAVIWGEARRWEAHYAEHLRRAAAPHANDPTPDRRLRIGYVSPDFRAHPVGRFLLPLLEAHDRNRFEVFCYSGVQQPDAVTKCCRAQADTWCEAGSMADADLAAQIRQDQIDILVDLSMHMAGQRLLVFARKPAPVQVTYLAYCSTTGLRAIDYRLTDPYLDPADADYRWYTEQSVHLPETYWCYRAPREAPPVNRLPALEAGGVTFACLNHFGKISRRAWDTWTALLRRVPGSRLLVHARQGQHRQWVRARMARHGVAAERVDFVDYLPLGEYFQTYHRADIALDPFPHAGGTTTCDALWMGVPVVSLAGTMAVGRGGASILTNVGHPELVTRDPEQYVAVAAELASDVPRLVELRAGLRRQMLHSPLMDAPRFARHVEGAYRAMWHRWCQQTASPSRP
jgi:predicted O-linked N-acetylglucosamine transferase (SPINDLY family)